MDVFITAANAKKLEAGFDRDKAKKLYIDDLYELSLWMLSRPEREWLAAARMFYQNPEFYIQSFYKKIESGTSKESDWVFVGGVPAYHFDNLCEKLHSDYENFEIPAEIVNRGNDEKQKFRDWFIENKSLFSDNPEKFKDRMEIKFALKNPPQMREFRADNSGIVIEQNPSLDDIQAQISKRLDLMKSKMEKTPN